MRSLEDFNWVTLRNGDVCLDSDTIAQQRALRVQVRKARGRGLFVATSADVHMATGKGISKFNKTVPESGETAREAAAKFATPWRPERSSVVDLPLSSTSRLRPA
jgi:hypothetical protein